MIRAASTIARHGGRTVLEWFVSQEFLRLLVADEATSPRSAMMHAGLDTSSTRSPWILEEVRERFSQWGSGASAVARYHVGSPTANVKAAYFNHKGHPHERRQGHRNHCRIKKEL